MDSGKESRSNRLVLQGDNLNSKQKEAALLEWTRNFLLLDGSGDDVNDFDHNHHNQNHQTNDQTERSPHVLNPHFNHLVLPPPPPPPSSPPTSPPPPSPPPRPPPQRHPVLCMTTDNKPRLCWTPELHQHFVECIALLGGPLGATPKNILRKMNVDGLTILQVKSHLQKYRATMLMESNELAHTTSPFQQHGSTSYEGAALKPVAEGTEKMPLQLPMQCQSLQSQVKTSLQIQEEALEKCLESLMKRARAYDFYTQATPRGSFKHQKCERFTQVPLQSPPCISAEQNGMQSHYHQLQRSLDIEQEVQKAYLKQQGYEICTAQSTEGTSVKCSKSENFSQVPFPSLPSISAEQTDKQSYREQLASLLPLMEENFILSEFSEVQTTFPSESPMHNNQHSPSGLTDSLPGSPLFGPWPEDDHYSFD